MKRVDIKVGFSCNNRCKFCVQGNKRKQYDDRETSEVKRILKEAQDDHEGVVFTGGEATLRDDLPELVQYANDLTFQTIQIQSNGRRFAYKGYCKELIDSGANQFALALHGSNSEIHDSLTNTPNSFEQTVAGIKNLIDMNQDVLMNTVITKPNFKDLPNIADLFIDLEVEQFQFAFIHINQVIMSNQRLIEEIVPRKSKVMPFVKEGLEKGINAGIRVMTEAIPFCFMEGYEDYIAEAGKIPNGSVYDKGENIKDYSNYRKTEGKKKADKCKKCKYYDVCEGPWKEYPQIFGWEEFTPVLE